MMADKCKVAFIHIQPIAILKSVCQLRLANDPKSRRCDLPSFAD
jgi:hypothetical protein